MRHPYLGASLLSIALATPAFAFATPALAAVPAHAYAPAHAAAPAHAEAVGCTDPIKPASVMKIEACDTPERIVEKAAHIVPRKGQLDWQRKELTTFTHFGMNTFTNREWGSGAEDEATFAPKSLDVDQWMRAYKAAGAKQAMFTVKHHDGFVLYPTRYSNHSVIASPWWVRTQQCSPQQAAKVKAARSKAASSRGTDASAYWQSRAAGCENQAGDILGDYVRAARKAGLRVGVYISPADGSELPHAWHRDWVKKVVAKHDAGKPLSIEEQATYDDRDRDPGGMGRYGSGSAIVDRTIPTLVKNDDRARAVAKGKLPSFKVKTDDYNAYYLNQIYELFTQYGPIDELWLDGANPWSGEGITEKYDFTAWFDLIHKLSPNTVVFGGPQGIRWIGNERGVARPTEWSVTPATADPNSYHNEWLLPEGASVDDIGSRAKITAPAAKYLQWFPGEADVSQRPGWFFHPDEKPKTPAQLVSLYDQSVGRNASLLLNVPPATDGRVADEDVASLTSFGTAIRETYRRDLAAGARQKPGGVYELSKARTFDRIRLGEDISRGQHVEGFTIEAWDGTSWKQITQGTTIGHSRILALPAPVTADKLRVTVTQTRATPYISTFGLYRTADPR
ncbi:alpha-L-fucosidase [Actinomadura barringtoniae]|uniref:alpha-L-fucosidase n=1 Tax=Actinomadura barringtoniae TaxID=1427535 RepID=A0A939PNK7_9ACTN|nr:alpha-L-fucosidase [Actinomadura barringtoniae]MBO2451861.1 alpha-L-fucosidase [Actinomadura barringtoniae]